MPRLRVRDETLNVKDLNSRDGVLKVIGQLVGRTVEITCSFNDVETCKKEPTRCQYCINADRLDQVIAAKAEWTVAKLNQILLLSEQRMVSSDFYTAFFGNSTKNETEFLAGLAQFRAYAMLRYGSFRYAFARLSARTYDAIERLLGRWALSTEERWRRLRARRHGTTLVRDISMADRWYTGYITAGLLENDVAMLLALDHKVNAPAKLTSEDKEKLSTLKPAEFTRMAKRVAELRRVILPKQDALRDARNVGLANTAAYLAANHIDVYVATSMREDGEFRAIATFLKEVFSRKSLGELADLVTYFDPTLSFSVDRIDKGLVEGLMLRLAECSIYMVQETDTLGKDSELATTLARGRAVIAYVPSAVPSDRFDESLDSLRKRALMLLAEERYEPGDVGDVYAILQKLVTRRSVLRVVPGNPDEVGISDKDLERLKAATLKAEQTNLERRAKTLRQDHPLALQVELETGVANGLLVARTPADCAKLLRQVLTNDLEFEIVDSKTQTDGRPSAVVLREVVTQSPFRVVTNHEMLTNAFWSKYFRPGDLSAPRSQDIEGLTGGTAAREG